MVKRNDESKVTIVEITKHDVRDVKQSSVVVLWDRKLDWQEGRILKLETKALSWEKQIYSSSFERKEGNEIGRKDGREEGLLVLGMGRTIECFQEEGKVERGRNLTYREGDQDIEEGTVEAHD